MNSPSLRMRFTYNITIQGREINTGHTPVATLTALGNGLMGPDFCTLRAQAWSTRDSDRWLNRIDSLVIFLNSDGKNELIAAYYSLYAFSSDGDLIDRAVWPRRPGRAITTARERAATRTAMAWGIAGTDATV